MACVQSYDIKKRWGYMNICPLLSKYLSFLEMCEEVIIRDKFPNNEMISSITRFVQHFELPVEGGEEGVRCALTSIWTVRFYSFLIRKLSEINYAQAEMNMILLQKSSPLPSKSINRWIVCHTTDDPKNTIHSILGSVFVYYNSDLYIPQGSNIIISSSQVNYDGARFVRMRGICPSITFLLTKMTFGNDIFSYVSDYLIQAVMSFANELGADIILADPLGVQGQVLDLYGFKQIESVNQIQFPPGSCIENGGLGWTITPDMMIYKL